MTTDAASTLTRCLEPALPPIALSFAEAIPDGMPHFEETVPAGCSFWERAARGAFATSADDHAHCAIGLYTHHLAGAPASQEDELRTTLRVLRDLEYVRDEDLAAIAIMPQPNRHVLYAPLSQCPFVPAVVLLLVDSRRSLVVAEAVQQVEDGLPPALGRPACAVIPQVLTSGRAALSLGCCGARAYLDVLSDDVALWALPGAKLDVYVQRIEKLAGANAVLSRFHQRRREDVASGMRPTVNESLARMS